MKSIEIYKRIGRRETASQKWNDLDYKEKEMLTKLAQGCIALVKLHNVGDRELAKYIMQYVNVKKGV